MDGSRGRGRAEDGDGKQAGAVRLRWPGRAAPSQATVVKPCKKVSVSVESNEYDVSSALFVSVIVMEKSEYASAAIRPACDMPATTPLDGVLAAAMLVRGGAVESGRLRVHSGRGVVLHTRRRQRMQRTETPGFTTRKISRPRGMKNEVYSRRKRDPGFARVRVQ